MKCPQSMLDKLAQTPSQFDGRTTISKSLTQEVDFFLDELSGINDTAAEYLCKEPVLHDWYYDLSSHKHPPKEKQHYRSYTEALMLQEVKEKIQNYQVYSTYTSKTQCGEKQSETMPVPVTFADKQKAQSYAGKNDVTAKQNLSKRDSSMIRSPQKTVTSQERIISNPKSQNSLQDCEDIFLRIEDEVWDFSKIRREDDDPCENEQEEALDLSTVQYNEVLNARYETITPPPEKRTDQCNRSPNVSHFRTVSPAQEVPQSPSPGYFTAATPSFYETQFKAFPAYNAGGSKRRPYRFYNPYPQVSNFQERHHSNHLASQANMNMVYPYYSYHNIPWIS